MIPQRFAQSNIVMTAPKGMEDQCSDIHAYQGELDGNKICITAYRPTPEEIVKLNLGGNLWLWIYGGGMPPVCLTTDDPFEERKSDE